MVKYLTNYNGNNSIAAELKIMLTWNLSPKAESFTKTSEEKERIKLSVCCCMKNLEGFKVYKVIYNYSDKLKRYESVLFWIAQLLPSKP